MNWEEAVELLRNDAAQANLVHDCYYDDPLVAAAGRFFESEEWTAVRTLIGPPRGRALDVGAGRGISSYALARDDWTVTALEPDPSAIVGASAIRKLARDADLQIEVVEHHGEILPFEDASFDLVYGRAVLHHARPLAGFCRELTRVLKPGGQLLATREHVINSENDLGVFLDSHPLHRYYGGEHAYLLDDYVSALSPKLKSLRVINSLESAINWAPQTMSEVQQGLSRRLHLPASWIHPILWRYLGRLQSAPGRLFSFYGVKSEDSP